MVSLYPIKKSTGTPLANNFASPHHDYGRRASSNAPETLVFLLFFQNCALEKSRFTAFLKIVSSPRTFHPEPVIPMQNGFFASLRRPATAQTPIVNSLADSSRIACATWSFFIIAPLTRNENEAMNILNSAGFLCHISYTLFWSSSRSEERRV